MIFGLVWIGMALSVQAAELSADGLISAMEKNIRGKTFAAVVEMQVKKPDIDRTLKMRLWTKGREKALVKILAPVKEKGTGNLRLGLELWQFLPNVDRVIRIPPSLMLQSWMGSNFTNDDLVRMSSLESDYTHKLVGDEEMNGKTVAKIECLPKPEAPVVWGKIMIWIDRKSEVGVREEFYTEKGRLVKTLVGSDIQSFGTHRIPTVLVMTDEKGKNSSTTIRYSSVEFDKDISDGTFTQQNLKVPPL